RAYLVRLSAIRVYDSRLTRFEQLGEEPQLCFQVGFEAWMIVHVIAAEIGEGGRRKFNPVEAVLIEPMRRRFKGEMRYAFACELRQHGVQRHRIGRRQRSVDSAARL